MARPTIMDAAIEMKVKRATDAINGVTVRPFDFAPEWEEAERLYREVMALPEPPKVALVPKEKREEEPAPPRKPKCTEHREWHFTFQCDGSTISRCRHSECGFGVTRKTHSDGAKAGAYNFGNAPAPEVLIPETQIEDAEEPDQPMDERPPLVAEVVVPQAGVDEPEEDPELEQKQQDVEAEYEHLETIFDGQ